MEREAELKIERTPITAYMARIGYWLAMVLLASFVSRDISVHCERGESSFCRATIRTAFMTVSDETVAVEDIEGIVFTEEETTTTGDNGISLTRVLTSVVIEVAGVGRSIELQDYSFVGSSEVKYQAGQDLADFVADPEATSLDFEFGDPFYLSSFLVLTFVGGMLYWVWIRDYATWRFELEVDGGTMRMTFARRGWPGTGFNASSEGVAELVVDDGQGRIAVRYSDGKVEPLCDPGWSKAARREAVAEASAFLRSHGLMSA
ncbi:MAG: hypothetical protein KUG77_21415 [Nannocystaceae bacterium]|nr:hypothetical protein [Nannocystaceae bacterium]